jgi:hypothetical protein
MDSERPLILLDVDGAISADAMGAPEANGYVSHITTSGTAVLSEAVNASIAALAVHGDLVWLTGWNERANQCLSPLMGLPELPVLDTEELKRTVHQMPPFPEHTWKLPVVREHVADTRSVAWIDDQIGDDVIVWANERSGSTLLVVVGATRGLHSDQLDQLDSWVAEPTPGVTQCFPPPRY